MTEDPGQGPAEDVSRLRQQRSALEDLTRDLMMWIGLLRNKALALRALAGGSAEGLRSGLVPGSLDPKALASALTAGLTQPWRAAATRPPEDPNLRADELISTATTLWQTVADPRDASASERLAEGAEALAAQMEVRVNKLLDLYRRLGDELVQALEGGRPREVLDAADEADGPAGPDAQTGLDTDS